MTLKENKENNMKKYFLFQKREGIETLVGRYNSKEEAQKRVMEMVEEDEVSIFDFHVWKNVSTR